MFLSNYILNTKKKDGLHARPFCWESLFRFEDLADDHLIDGCTSGDHRKNVLRVGSDYVEQEGFVAIEHFLNSVAKFFFLVYSTSWKAEAIGDLNVVRIKAS